MSFQLGNWRLLRKLGEGNFGYTYLGEHVLLGFQVAVKVEKVGTPEAIEAFKTEARAYSELRHPYLPTLHDYLEMPDPREPSRLLRLMVLSFIPGQSLTDAVEEHGNPTDEHICWIVDRLLFALSYLNYKGILHLDVKPDNILLNIPHHEATLVDLGMASIRPRSGDVARGGSPMFMAPEVFAMFTPGPESDLYSVGKVVCWLSGGDPANGIFGPDMDPRFSSFFEEWIRHDPRSRPRNFAALRDDLADLRTQVFGRVGSVEAWESR